ncbi:protein-glutamate O-methyltransferase-like isoform X2 [Zootermopsis nevadensis]|uniref:protein-glutamate O-methyltransferase-like isoform X2 n=1 Tax=Zootermopsis nevadensis TaxID=136037 RepID=UPI000B8EBCDE|nr:protein-glutamate O-methyltransferase-like isoform X2 [Zootermopsis nevadensis]
MTIEYNRLLVQLSRSFAYLTVRDRLPITVTKVIDCLVRDKEKIVKTLGEYTREELKKIIGSFSELKNELLTDKPFKAITSDGPDVSSWNAYYMKENEREGSEPRWFHTSWLYAECYMYRRIHEAFELSISMKTFDPFHKQKKEAFFSSLASVIILGDHVWQQCQMGNLPQLAMKEELLRLIKVALWGNQHDLSRPSGYELPEESNLFEHIDQLHECILIDDSECIWSILTAAVKGNSVIDIVNDNAGYEIFTDLCLADVLCTFSLADKVRFHVKAMPWFISDATKYDFYWVLQMMAELSHKSSSLPALATRWEEYLQSGRWMVEAEDFWTLPHSYNKMKATDNNLYNKLSEATLVIFKGDLNYRKLVGETNWLATESFANALQGFHPAPLVTLRTLKADLICGLQPGQAEMIAAKSRDWMISGNYAVIQFDG